MSEDTVILSIYCNHKEQAEQTLVNLLGSVWRQLALKKGAISDLASKLYKKHTAEQSRPTVNELVTYIDQELQNFSRAYMVVDALDECKRDMMASLVLALRSVSEKCHLLFTSRPLLIIEELLDGFSRLDINADTEDMEAYIYGRMYPGSQIVNLINSRPDSIQRDAVKDIVIKRAAGM
jgi:hypothetical protein